MKRHRALPLLLVGGVLLIAGALLWPASLPRSNSAANRRDSRGAGLNGRRPPAPAVPAPAVPAPIIWRSATGAARRDAIASIRSQLDAFRRDDYAGAMRYQSAGLRRNFPSMKAFRNMMKLHYPQFARYRNARFGPARSDLKGRRVAVPVAVTGRDGVRVGALYVMIREGDIFRVEGVKARTRTPRTPSVEA